MSRPEGFHLQPLAEPDVNLSAHPAPIIQVYDTNPIFQCMKAPGWPPAIRLSVSAARVLRPARCLCLRISHRIRNRFMLRHTGLSADS